jgi:hypothetical protein
MSKEWLWWLGEFGLAAVVAVVAGFVTKDIPISILYGLFVGTVFFVLRQQTRIASQHERQVSEMEDKALNLPVTLMHLEDVDPYLKKLARSARDEALRLAKEAMDGQVVFRSRPIMHMGWDLIKLARPGDRVFATNYGVVFDTPQGEMYRQINFDLADKGVHITRVFIEGITAKPEEKKRLKQEMDRQKEGHINVRFVNESRLPPEVRKHMLMLYDRYVAYMIFAKPGGDTRHHLIMDEFRIYTRRDELEKAKESAETVLKLSEEYK